MAYIDDWGTYDYYDIDDYYPDLYEGSPEEKYGFYFDSDIDCEDPIDEIQLIEEAVYEADLHEAMLEALCPPGGIIGLHKDILTAGKKTSDRTARRARKLRKEKRCCRKYWRGQKVNFLHTMAAHAEMDAVRASGLLV